MLLPWALLAAWSLRRVACEGASARGAAARPPGSRRQGGEDDKLAHCRNKTDPHGVWNGSTAPGGEYTLTCNPGYEVEGERTVTLTCSQREVQWPADPWCENTDDCANLVYGCGPAGLCVDHVGYSECLCENGAVMHNTSHGEVVCYFKNETIHCGGRNCGAHGICIDLEQYQDSFDTGKDSFRCSCERGYHDDGSSCVPRNCGPRKDSLGKWSGVTTYTGEYTLECEEGAFLWGGSQQAITITCPADGMWKSHPICQSPAQLAHDADMEAFRWWVNIYMAVACVICAALAAGLTMGLVSLDEREMQIIDEAQPQDCTNEEEMEKLERDKIAARQIAPILQDHYRLLVTLLLLNAIANEALPIFLDDLMPPFMAVLVSVTFVLLCGEIFPSAIFTGPMQLTVAACFVPCVQLLKCILMPIAKPIATALDRYLPHDEEKLYSRPELRAVLALHSAGDPRGEEEGGEVEEEPLPSRRSSGTISASSSRPFLEGQSPRSPLRDLDPTTPLKPLEAELCFGILQLGETTVDSCLGFCSLRVCSSGFKAVIVSSNMTVSEAVRAAAEEAKEAVVVFRNRHGLAWPAEVPVHDLLGVATLAQLLAEPPSRPLVRLRLTPPPQVQTNQTVTTALQAIASECGTPRGFATVVQRGEFAGLLDGERALMELFQRGSRPPILPPTRLSPTIATAVKEGAQVTAASCPTLRMGTPSSSDPIARIASLPAVLEADPGRSFSRGVSGVSCASDSLQQRERATTSPAAPSAGSADRGSPTSPGQAATAAAEGAGTPPGGRGDPFGVGGGGGSAGPGAAEQPGAGLPDAAAAGMLERPVGAGSGAGSEGGIQLQECRPAAGICEAGPADEVQGERRVQFLSMAQTISAESAV